MEKIQIRDINISALKKLSCQGTKSIIYTDGNLCYKLFKGLYPAEKEDIYNKFIEMEGLNLNRVLLPIDFIMQDDKFQGYTMKYFKDSMPLSYKYLTRYFNCKDLFNDLHKASLTLRDLHQQGIICHDLSFENILVDKNDNIMFADIDGCCYKNHYAPFISVVLKSFLIDWRRSQLYKKEDIDNLSMILSLYILIYDKELQNIKKRQYHSLSDKIKTLENLRAYANLLITKKQPIYNLPYLDEVIDSTDDYIIDRNKQLNLVQRFLTR